MITLLSLTLRVRDGLRHIPDQARSDAEVALNEAIVGLVEATEVGHGGWAPSSDFDHAIKAMVAAMDAADRIVQVPLDHRDRARALIVERLLVGVASLQAVLADRRVHFDPARCPSTCPHGDRCTLSEGHEGGHNHQICGCNEPNTEAPAPDAGSRVAVAGPLPALPALPALPTLKPSSGAPPKQRRTRRRSSP